MSEPRTSTAWIVVFWIGFPLFILGCLFAIPRAFAAVDSMSRLLFASIPVTGLTAAAIALLVLIRRAQSAGKNKFETQWLKSYYLEIGMSVVVYVALSIVCVPLAVSAGDPFVKVVLGLAPAIGIVLCALAVARWIARADEYQRQRMLQAVGVAAAITAVWTMSYGFLEVIGFPRLSMFWVWPSMAAVWMLWAFITGVARAARE